MIRDKFNKYYELLGQIETLSIKEKPKGGVRIEDAELMSPLVGALRSRMI
jgi:hypothetical protein